MSSPVNSSSSMHDPYNTAQIAQNPRPFIQEQSLLEQLAKEGHVLNLNFFQGSSDINAQTEIDKINSEFGFNNVINLDALFHAIEKVLPKNLDSRKAVLYRFLIIKHFYDRNFDMQISRSLTVKNSQIYLGCLFVAAVHLDLFKKWVFYTYIKNNTPVEIDDRYTLFSECVNHNLNLNSPDEIFYIIKEFSSYLNYKNLYKLLTHLNSEKRKLLFEQLDSKQLRGLNDFFSMSNVEDEKILEVIDDFYEILFRYIDPLPDFDTTKIVIAKELLTKFKNVPNFIENQLQRYRKFREEFSKQFPPGQTTLTRKFDNFYFILHDMYMQLTAFSSLGIDFRTGLSSSQSMSDIPDAVPVKYLSIQDLTPSKRSSLLRKSQELCDQLMDCWNKKHENLRRLLTQRQGYRVFDLNKAVDAFNVPQYDFIKILFEPLYIFFIELDSRSETVQIELGILADVIRTLKIVLDQQTLLKIFPNNKPFCEFACAHMSSTSKRLFANRALDFSANQPFLLSLRDILFYYTTRELAKRTSSIDTMLQQPASGPLKNRIISACFLFPADDMVEVHPLTLLVNDSTNSLIAIGKDDQDSSVTKLLKQIVPSIETERAITEGSTTKVDKAGFAITVEESGLLLDNYKKNPDTFFLLMPLANTQFKARKSASKAHQSQATKELEHKEAAAGVSLPSMNPSTLAPKSNSSKKSSNNSPDPKGEKVGPTKSKPKEKSLPSFVPEEMDLSDEPEEVVPMSDEDGDVEIVERTPAEKSAFSASNSSAMNLTISSNPFDILNELCQETEKFFGKHLERIKFQNNAHQMLQDSLVELSSRLSRKESVRLSPLNVDVASLKEYQKEGVDFLRRLSECDLNGVIAIEPGLGKTLLSFETVRQRQKVDKLGRPAVYIIPNSIVEQTREELEKHFYLIYLNHYNNLINRKPPIDLETLKLLTFSISNTLADVEAEREKIHDQLTELNRKKSNTKTLKSSLESIITKIDLLERRSKLLHERVKEIEAVLMVATNHPNIIRALNAVLRSEKSQKFQIKVKVNWIIGILNRLDVQKNKQNLGMALNELSHRNLFNLKKELKAEFDKPELNFEKIEIILTVAFQNAEFLSMPMGIEQLEKFLIAIVPPLGRTPAFSSSVSQELEYDPSILKAKLSDRILTHTSDNPIDSARLKGCVSGWPIILTTQSALKSEKGKNAFQVIRELPVHTVIVDEAHKFVWDITNKVIKKESSFVLDLLKTFKVKHNASIALLTGTPFVNSPEEMISLFQMANPHLPLEKLGIVLSNSLSHVGKKAEDWMDTHPENRPERNGSMTSVFTNTLATFTYAKNLLRQLLCIYRHNDSQVIRDWTQQDGSILLPEKELMSLHYQLTGHQNEKLKEAQKIKNMLKLQAAVQKIFFHPSFYQGEYGTLDDRSFTKEIATLKDKKLAQFIQSSGFLIQFFDGPVLNTAIRENKSIIIFVFELNQGETIQHILKQKYPELQTRFFNGSSSFEERNRIVKEFEAGIAKVVILSSAGGLGLNMKKADVLFDLASGWNESLSEQAQARAIRANTLRKKVHVYRFENDTTHEKRKKKIILKKINWKEFFTSSDDLHVSKTHFLNAFESSCFQAALEVTEEEWVKKEETLQSNFSHLRNLFLTITDQELQTNIQKILTIQPSKSETSSSSSHELSLTAGVEFDRKAEKSASSHSNGFSDKDVVMKPEPSKSSVLSPRRNVKTHEGDAKEEFERKVKKSTQITDDDVVMGVEQPKSKPQQQKENPGTSVLGHKRKDAPHESDAKAEFDKKYRVDRTQNTAAKMEDESEAILIPEKRYSNPDDMMTRLSVMPLLNCSSLDKAKQICTVLLTRESNKIPTYLSDFLKLQDDHWKKMWEDLGGYLGWLSSSKEHNMGNILGKLLEWNVFQSTALKVVGQQPVFNQKVFTLTENGLQLCPSECLQVDPKARTMRFLKSKNADGETRYDLLMK